MTVSTCTASVDGIAKKGQNYTYLLSAPTEFIQDLKAGDPLVIAGVLVSVSQCQDEYLSFDMPLSSLIDSPLAELEVGVTVTLERSA